ncbi:MFS transporter [Streptomyces sp. NPDC049954]|uniref:MFS transporter n=1 Tax=Streptomyces sp. NPDC049954 TaxID=3155779 RepID=UPI0034426DB4
MMTVLDGSIVTVAMPTLQRDLGFGAASLSWVVNAYLLAFGGLLLLAGRLGDLVGRRKVFLTGIGLFTAASLFAGTAGSPAALIVARALQGVGSALASAVALGILVTLFTGRRERAGALAVFAFTGSVGASLGQVLGGVLTDALGWHWIFLINLPIGVAVVLGALRSLPADTGPGLRAGADAPGALLVTAGLVLGIHDVVNVETYGWTSARTLGLGALALLLLAGFFVRQARARTPLMPLRVLRSRAVAGANLVLMLTVAAMFAFQIVLALYLQQVLGYGATASGLAMLPAALAIGVFSLGVSARLNARFGERRVVPAGLVLLIALQLLLSRIPVDAQYPVHVLPLLLLAAGFGLALPGLTALGMSGAGPADAGLVSGLFNTSQQIGMALGAAVLTTLAAGRTERLRAGGHGAAESLAGGYHLAFTVGAGLLTAALLVTLTVLRRHTPPELSEPSATSTVSAPAKSGTA